MKPSEANANVDSRAKGAPRARFSRYLRMRDGVDVAIDVHLPAAIRSGQRVPTIVRQTRYLRSVEWRAPLDAFTDRWFADVSRRTRRALLARGYAWVDVDARGSGASFGRRPCPWHEDEVRDGGEVVDWIVAQPWSSGRVGATGVSYEGTTAEMLLVNGHPAVKAVIPQFCLFDAYADVAFPGGIHYAQFTEFWSRMNRSFDRNEPHVFLGMWLALAARGHLDKRLASPALVSFVSERLGRTGERMMSRLLRGVRRTEDDVDYARVADAIAAHAENEDVHRHALQVVSRDDVVPSTILGRGASIDTFSPRSYVSRIDASGAAILGYTGWWDMGYPRAAIARHRSLTHPGNRLVIGPWDHGGKRHIGPAIGARRSGFDHEVEFARFFDFHLKGEGAESEAPIRYFTMGEETWKTCGSWPPAADVARLFLAADRRLTFDGPGGAPASDRYEIDYSATSGHLSRWKNGIGMPIDYSDRKRCDEKLLVYDTPPLERATEVTGHPVVTLHLVANAADAHVFAYLEEVTPWGDVRYVTEGCLRALHRKIAAGGQPRDAIPLPIPRTFLAADATALVAGEVAELTFDLLPTSYLFRKGHRIRLAIAGADRDHVTPLRDPPSTFHVHRGALHPSHLALPVVRHSQT